MVDVGNDSLVGRTFGVPFGGAGLESGREVEVRIFVGPCRTLDVECVLLVEGILPVPGECRDAACLP